MGHSRIGLICAPKLRALTTSAQRPTSSACRYLPITSKTRSRSSVFPATNKEDTERASFAFVALYA